MDVANHLYSAFNHSLRNSTKIFENAKNRLANYNFDSIACSGVSGLSMAAPLAFHFNKDLIYVRKTTENCHSDYIVEGLGINFTKIIIVDDIISSGKTLQRIVSAIRKRSLENRKHYEKACKRSGTQLKRGDNSYRVKFVKVYLYYTSKWDSKNLTWSYGAIKTLKELRIK